MAAKKVDKRDEAFNGAIGRYIESKRMNKTELAERLGVRRETVWQWQNNPSRLSLGYFRALVREAQISDEDILMIVRGAR